MPPRRNGFNIRHRLVSREWPFLYLQVCNTLLISGPFRMSRSFYSYAIFLTVLNITTGFLPAFLIFLLGPRATDLHSLPNLFIVSFAVWLIWSLVMMKYLQYKRYLVASWTLVPYMAASLFYFVVFLKVLSTHEITVAFFAAMLAAPLAGLVHGASLVWSRSSERRWLKLYGIFPFLLSLISVSFIIWALLSSSAVASGTLATVERWIGLVSSLITIPVLINFVQERRHAKQESDGALEYGMAIVGFVVVVAMLFMMPGLTVEAARLATNPQHVSDHLRNVAQPFEAHTYVNDRGMTLPYRLLIPTDYDSAKTYPLVVCLHGSSACGNDNIRQIAGTLPARILSRPENRIKFPAFLLVPQCPLQSSWGGIPGVPSVDSLVFETIATLEGKYSIDSTRRYVTGYSLGGYGTWHLISTRPDFFAAAVPMCGGGNPELASRIVDVPVWAFHGARDRNVPVSGSRDIIEAIKKHGGNPRYTEFADKAHDITKSVDDTPGLFEWMFQQRTKDAGAIQ